MLYNVLQDRYVLLKIPVKQVNFIFLYFFSESNATNMNAYTFNTYIIIYGQYLVLRERYTLSK